MVNSPDVVREENARIKDALGDVVSCAGEYFHISTKNAGKKSIELSGEVSEAKTAFTQLAFRLLEAVKGPVDMVYHHFETVAHTGAVRALLEMGVFHALPEDGSSKTAEELAQTLKVDKQLLVRLMRIATALGPFKEVGPEEFAHTQYSTVYLRPEVGGIFKITVDEYGPSKIRFSEFFKSNGWSNPTSSTDNPYTFAHQTGGKDVWQYMTQFPERLKNFNYAMAAQTQSGNWTVGIFPFQRELEKLNTSEETLLVVDVGGGKGHATREIKNLCPNIKGRMILQDRAEVIAEVTELPTGIEKMGYDFFTPQPAKGALIYHIRRCLHDWSDEVCIKILKVIAEAMEPQKSRVVIGEMLIPAVGADAEASWVDLTMMTFSGTERTETQWNNLLDAAGLKMKKIHTATGTNYSAIEAELK